jgi:hypothetical protein
MTTSNSAIVRINQEDKKILEQLARETGKSIPKVIHSLVQDFYKRHFFAGLKSDFARLKAKKADWQEALDENELFEGAVADGLDDL